MIRFIPLILEEGYNTGYQAFWSSDYQKAAEQFGLVVFIDQTYHDGDALFYLAESQWNLWNFEEAVANYQKVIDANSDSAHARTAQERIDEYQANR